MNNRQAGGPDQQNSLSLLVSAAENRDGARAAESGGSGQGYASVAEQLARRGLGGDGGGLSLEEQLLLHQQLQGQYGGAPSSGGLLSALQRDQSFLSQLGGGGSYQQQQLASLLGLGGSSDMHSALAAAQLRQQQQHQFTQADLLALSRSGALSGLSGLLGGGAGSVSSLLSGLGGSQGFASELEGIQRLEELERRQRLFAAGAAGGAQPPQQAPSSLSAAQPALRRPEETPASPKVMQDTSSPRLSAARPEPKQPVAAAPVPDAAPASEEGKEELEKAPGSVIVPCRARGMPMDHNFKTAYFVIPENVKHGEELICSYFACRNAGIKFRYCSSCKVPVAKRNFRKRHKHGGEEIVKIAGDDSDGEEEPVAKKQGIPSQITANHKEAVEADGISSQSTDSNPQEKTEADVQKGLVRTSVRTFETSKKAGRAANAAPKGDSAKVSNERQKRWMELLSKRPSTKDGDSMSTWLMEVLAVSDLETPLKPLDDGVLVSDETRTKSTSSKKAKAGTESPRSDNGYPSSNDGAGAFNGGVVKKKRPAESKEEAEPGSQPSEYFVSGSFAAWKERKKQKKQAKVGPQPVKKSDSPV